ncbi:MAG: two-component system, NarL family, nitrate/nitrite response regulator NarL [Actinomycetota bacterium]|jgi:DNA-binding NarL/FixJ family response regulator|nr:two-component system, NarL family, nitrate/nitrite response regulator NarL [Actinomycetota bacterium]
MMDASRSAAPVLLLDDHRLISTTLLLALRTQGVEAVQLPITGFDEILASAARYRPGLALLDLDLGERVAGPPPNGLRLIDPLRSQGWSVLIVTASRNRGAIAAAIARGAIGWVSKAEPFDRLLAVVLDAKAGRDVLPAALRDEFLRLHRKLRAHDVELIERVRRLSSREREVLDRLACGRSAAVVAADFTVSLATVRAQIRSILAKLDVQSQLAAVAIINEAKRAGII